MPLVLRDYGDKVRLVYRDFPLTRIHPFAAKAAEAAQCAAEEDAFWEYHDLLFANQDALDDASLKRYSEQVGLDGTAFAECLDTGRYADEVQRDYADGLAAGVEGTPTFYINDRLLSGAQPFEVFQAAIESALGAGGQ